MLDPRSGKIPFPLRIVPQRFLDGAEYSIAQRLGWHENRPLVHVNADMRLILVLSLRNAPGDSVSYFAFKSPGDGLGQGVFRGEGAALGRSIANGSFQVRWGLGAHVIAARVA